MFADDPVLISTISKSILNKNDSVFFNEDITGKQNLSKILLNEVIAFEKKCIKRIIFIP